MTEKKEYFKITTVKPLAGKATEVPSSQSSGGGKMSVRIGGKQSSKRIPNQHEGIRVIDPRGSSIDDGGGFLGNRFGKK